ncbi:hypothetical protein Tco_1481970 [Tanacetum coccineum]
MDNTRAQQKALDDELVTLADRLKIGKSNLRLNSILKSKEPTLQIFEELLLEEEILSFIRDLGHTREIKFLSDVKVNHMHQPWRSFATIINKCLSGKTTALLIMYQTVLFSSALDQSSYVYNTLCFQVIDDVDKSAMYLLYCTHLL